MLTLTPRLSSRLPLDANGVTADRLAKLSLVEILKLPLLAGNRTVELGECFSVSGDAADADILIDGDCRTVNRLGVAMSGGRLTIRGDIGGHCGASSKGGTIEVHGSAGDWCGAELRGGTVRVHGNVGRLAGAAYPGSLRGMRGGTLIIQGNCGERTGEVMRRGLIVVGGTCGDHAAAHMIAGSLFVFGRTGDYPGAGMKRGTLALLGGAGELLPTFRFNCQYEPVFLSIYLQQMRTWGLPVPSAQPLRRFGGDLVALGKGEILLPA